MLKDSISDELAIMRMRNMSNPVVKYNCFKFQIIRNLNVGISKTMKT